MTLRAGRDAAVTVAVIFGASFLGPLLFLKQLSSGVAHSHPYWYDAAGHMFLAKSRFEALASFGPLTELPWFAPYDHTGAYADLALPQALLFGLWRLVVGSDPLAFNFAMVSCIALNGLALNRLLTVLGNGRWMALVFALAGTLTPFAWSRYWAPPNVLLAPGLLAVAVLWRASYQPGLRSLVTAALLCVVQVSAGFYLGAFFAIFIACILPFLVPRALQSSPSRARLLGSVIAAAGIASLLLWPLARPFSGVRRELGTVNDYEYVSHYLRKGPADLFRVASFSCRWAAFGVPAPGSACDEEMFPGWVLVGVCAAGLLAGLPGLFRTPRRRWVREVSAGGAATLLAAGLGQTWPMHVWLLSRPLLGGSDGPAAAFSAAAFVLVDIALNPFVVELPGFELQSVFRWLIHLPGLDGLRSEYRIIALVPSCLAVVGAQMTARWTAGAVPGWAGRVGFAGLSLLVLLTGLPAWRTFKTLPDSGAPAGPVLSAARALPPEAVLVTVSADGTRLRAATAVESNLHTAEILIHGHRTLNGYSTYLSPVVQSLERILQPGQGADREAADFMRLAGASHLIVDWGERKAPPDGLGAGVAVLGLKPIVSDGRRVLYQLMPVSAVVSGPVADDLAGAPLQGRLENAFVASVAGAPSIAGTAQESIEPQRVGDAVTVTFAQPETVGAVSFSVGLRLESLPRGFVVEVAEADGSWRMVASRPAWFLSQSLVDRPTSGEAVVAFDPVTTGAVRMRLTASSPRPWYLTQFRARGPAPTQFNP